MMSGAEAILDRIAIEQQRIDWGTVELYRKVFSTDEGKRVLSDILSVLGFFSMVEKSTEEALLQNISRLLLYKCGIWQNANARDVVSSLMDLEPRVPDIRGE